MWYTQHVGIFSRIRLMVSLGLTLKGQFLILASFEIGSFQGCPGE